MKKSILTLASIVLIAMAISCSDDNPPEYNDPSLSSEAQTGLLSSSDEQTQLSSSSIDGDGGVSSDDNPTEPDSSSSSEAQTGLSSSSDEQTLLSSSSIGGISSSNGDVSSSSGGNETSSGSGSDANEYYRYYDPYSTVAQRCQDGFVEIKCNGEWYSPATHICYGSEIITLSEYYAQYLSRYGYTQCGDSWYDTSTSMYRCQDGVLEVNPNYDANRYELCGNRFYLTSSQRCQNGVVENSCGDELWYNYTTQVCHAENINGTVSRTVIDKVKCGESNFVIENKSICGGQEYDAVMQGCCNAIVFDIAMQGCCNTILFNIENQRCQNKVVQNKCGTGWLSATENCYDGISSSVPHGGQTYRTVGIGSQMWMAENLNYAVEGSKCYDDDPANCNTYGRLYNWATAMVLDASCNSSRCSGQIEIPHKGICPEGWHIPTDKELKTLINYVGSDAAGTKLKAINGWNSSGNSTDEYSFSALPGGLGRFSYFVNVKDCGYWWSADRNIQGNTAYPSYWGMCYNRENVGLSVVSNPDLFSVRCLKD